VLGRRPLALFALGGATLQEAYLSGANLQEANLDSANLQKAHLEYTNLQKANLFAANLQGAIFEPVADSLPVVSLIARAQGLSELTFDLPFAAVELREAFKKAGLHDQQRQLTRAINYTLTYQELHSKDVSQRMEAAFRWGMFEVPCQYGLYPGRLLRILGASLLIFAVVYWIALRTHSVAGIWAVWLPDRINKQEGKDTPERVTEEFFFSTRTNPSRWARPLYGLRWLWIAFYFSLLSAFQIGWHDLNVGSWISRVQSREYTLRATGWVRTVSGLQSLLSVYLLALWVLTYFGDPFE
jgi:hypothetical protein